MGWETPRNVANVVKEVVDPPKDARFLDVAAGTGLLCKFLHQFGYSNFDALDPSMEMLKVAESREIYSNFFNTFIGGGAVPEFEKEAYDIVVMSGAFVEGHCPVDAWDDMIDAVRPGGHVVCSMTEKYLREVPAFFEMEEYIDDVLERKNSKLVERRIVEKSLLGKESIIVWIVRKLES
jgi:SAM-dependent methyltransferase